MAEYQSISHAKYDIKYHIVWITKYRYKVITKEIGKRLKSLLIQGCQSRGMTIVSGHIAGDHVHLLYVMSTESGALESGAVSEGSKFEAVAGGIFAIEEEVLGATSLGWRLFLCDSG